MNVFKVIPILSITLFFFSCQSELFQDTEETSNTQAPYIEVDERLWSYFQTFETEAAARGLSIDLNTIGTTGEISIIPENGVAGTCQYGSHINHVTVDSDFWNRSSQLMREFVVFHELGHCILHRDHEESSFNNGICRSIMRSGLEDCRDAYIQQNRTYYIDELFSTNLNITESEQEVL